MLVSPNTFGRIAYLKRKICGFNNIRIRVDGASNGLYGVDRRTGYVIFFASFSRKGFNLLKRNNKAFTFLCL